MEKTVTRRPRPAKLSPRRQKELENQLADALIDKAEARQFFEHARHYLMQCTRKVQDLKAQMYYGEEACHGTH